MVNDEKYVFLLELAWNVQIHKDSRCLWIPNLLCTWDGVGVKQKNVFAGN